MASIKLSAGDVLGLVSVSRLVEDNLQWAGEVAATAARKLPPSLDVEDLKQEARIALWKAAEKYDESKGVPFRAFAWTAVRGAVYMKARRKHYRDATMDEMPAVVVDHSPNPEQLAIAAEESRSDEQDKQRAWLIKQLDSLSASQAYLVRRAYLDGVGIEELAACWHVEPKEITARITRAIRYLRGLRRDGELEAA